MMIDGWEWDETEFKEPADLCECADQCLFLVQPATRSNEAEVREGKVWVDYTSDEWDDNDGPSTLSCTACGASWPLPEPDWKEVGYSPFEPATRRRS